MKTSKKISVISIFFCAVLAFAQHLPQNTTQHFAQNLPQNPQKTNPTKTTTSTPQKPATQNNTTPPKSQTPLTSPSHINDTKSHIAYNGTAYIFITDEENPKPLKFGTKNIYWLAHPTRPNTKIALVGVPYRANLGKVSLKDGLILEVKAGNYKKEQITVTDTSKVRPNAAQQERIARELEEANKIYLTRTSKRLWSEKFELPLGSVITSHYGNARMFNNEVKSYHAGTDFRALIGTPIKAANNGKIALAKERFLSGKSVVIDHGEGIYSAYFHCSELKVAVGDSVKKGQIIALSGDTGRVSGAHLHFSMMVQGVSVDALHFITTLNSLFE